MYDRDKCDKKNKGDVDMNTVAKPKPVQSLDLHFKSDEAYEEFIDFVCDPSEPSDFVKELIGKYEEKNKEKQ